MPFDPQTSKIAITIPHFKLLANADSIFDRYSEPYIVSLAVDEADTKALELEFNLMPFPKVRKGATVRMLGDGHLLYGPANPGEFVAMSVLIMESDRDLRTLGERLDEIVKSKAVDLGVKAVLAANPGSAAVLGVLKEMTQHIAGSLKNNKDDELFRTDGVFLRDSACPYHVDREYTLGNSWVDVTIRIIPLDASNGEGAAVKKIAVPDA